MVVLHPTQSGLFAVPQHPVSSDKSAPAPSNATVTANAPRYSSPHPPAGHSVKQQLQPQSQPPQQQCTRRVSSATATAVNRKGSHDKRVNHNAIERARRDSLNHRFFVRPLLLSLHSHRTFKLTSPCQYLASKIPAISEVRRPSKSLIVNRSLQFVADSLSREALYRKMLIELHDRTRVLTEQLNEYRLANGLQNYVEAVPDLVLPVALADVPKDKPTARIVGRKSNMSVPSVDGYNGADDEYGMEGFDDGPFPVDEGIRHTPEELHFLAHVPMSSKPTDMPVTHGSHAPMPMGSYPAGLDVNGATFFNHALSASPMTSSPVSQPDQSVSSTSGSPINDSSRSPIAVPPHRVDTVNHFAKMFPMLLPDAGDYAVPTDLTRDLTSLFGPQSYHA